MVWTKKNLVRCLRYLNTDIISLVPWHDKVPYHLYWSNKNRNGKEVGSGELIGNNVTAVSRDKQWGFAPTENGGKWVDVSELKGFFCRLGDKSRRRHS